MAGRKMFGGGPIGAVTVVETPVSQAYARKARIAFLGVAAATGVMTAAVAAMFLHPLAAVALGIAVAFVSGLVSAAWVVAWPVVRVLWWWFFELTALAVLVLLPAWMARHTGPWPALAAVLTVVVLAVAVTGVRRWLAAWGWCLIVRHRLRLCFAEFLRSGSRAHAGRLPLILWALPTPAGERVWLWLRPGLDLAELEGRTGKLAVACWAGEARVVRASQRYAALLRVDIARRDPLADDVGSPLADLIPRPDEADAPVSPGLPPLGLDLADVPEPSPEPRTGRRDR